MAAVVAGDSGVGQFQLSSSLKVLMDHLDLFPRIPWSFAKGKISVGPGSGGLFEYEGLQIAE